jgi:hypothetical protein
VNTVAHPPATPSFLPSPNATSTAPIQARWFGVCCQCLQLLERSVIYASGGRAWHPRCYSDQKTEGAP